MNNKELVALFKSLNINERTFGDWVVNGYDVDEFDESGTLSKLGLKHISQDGGGEGGGENCEAVFFIAETYFKTEFRYASYAGYDFDELFDNLKVVKPVQRMHTFYE